MVHLVDQVQMSWQHLSNQTNGPLFESFRKYSMVRVGKSLLSDLESLVIRQHLLVYQDPEQLNGGYCWVSVIELDLILL